MATSQGSSANPLYNKAISAKEQKRESGASPEIDRIDETKEDICETIDNRHCKTSLFFEKNKCKEIVSMSSRQDVISKATPRLQDDAY